MKIRVLQVVTLSELGGAQKVVYHLAAGLNRAKFEITVACAPGGELVHWLETANVKVVELPCLKRNISPWNDVRCLWKLYRMIKANKYDIVHCHSSKAGILGRLAAYLAGVRRIYFTVHGWGIDEGQSLPVRWLYTMAERLGGSVSTRVVCVSAFDRKKGLSLGLVIPEKLVMIHNGMPDVCASETGALCETQVMPGGAAKYAALRWELGLGDKDILIGTVMRLALPKQPLMFLELSSRLVSETHARFVIIGDGPLRMECEKYIADHGLDGKVFMLGTRENAAQMVAGFDIFTLFSKKHPI